MAHSSPSPMRSVEENILLEIRPSVSQCDPQYSELQQKLSSLSLYTLTTSPQLIDIYADIGWIKVKMYRYSHGNSLGNMTFVWRVPSDSAEDHTSTARTIAVLNSKQQLFCTRQMRRDFIS